MPDDIKPTRFRFPITAEDLKLLATPGEELKTQAYIFSFDEEQFNKRLSGGERWQQLLQAHLYFDHVVTRCLTDVLTNPDAIDLRRMGFAQKLQLISAHDVAPSELVSAIGFMNGLRNKIAHDLNFEITDPNVLDFVNCTPKRLRDAILKSDGREPGPIRFHELLHVLLISLEIRRQERAFRVSAEKKAAIRLRTILGKTPGAVYNP